jgi:hypothetical protein
MRRHDQGGCIAAVHRILDLGDRFLAVFPEVTENADEARSQLGAGSRENAPIYDGIGLLIQSPLLFRSHLFRGGL